jgi:hypothetical protein
MNRLQKIVPVMQVQTDVPCRCGKGTSPAWRPEIHWVKWNGRSEIGWCD